MALLIGLKAIALGSEVASDFCGDNLSCLETL